jgi:pyridoxine kinase
MVCVERRRGRRPGPGSSFHASEHAVSAPIEVTRQFTMRLLSIQSHVAFGHVGNAAAVFPLQRLGCEVWPIHTVQFSNHTGYGRWRGSVFAAAMIRDVAQGMAELGVLAACDAVLSGYIGSVEIGEAILGAVAAVRTANPVARYSCDPVIGDVGRGVFVQPGVPQFIRERAVPAADLVTPNQFELEYLADRATPTLGAALDAVEALHALGPRTVLVTSLHTEQTPANAIELLASDVDGRFRLRTPKLPLNASGAGDAIAALFLFHYERSGSLAEALGRAASSMFGVLAKTQEAGSREMLLIEAQEELVNPTRLFVAEKI